MIKVLKKAILDLKQLSEGAKIRAWPVPEVVTEVRCNTPAEIIDHLRVAAGLSEDFEIWERKSIEAFVKRQTRRKRRYVYLLWTFSALIIFSILSFGFGIYVAGGESNSNRTPQSLGVLFLFLGLGSLVSRRDLGKNKFEVKAKAFLSQQLTPDQKDLVSAEIERLLKSENDIFLKVNYSDYRCIPNWVLSSENSFLLFTGVAKDQKGVILFERPPLGPICLKRDRVWQENRMESQENVSEETADSTIDKLKAIIINYRYDFKATAENCGKNTEGTIGSLDEHLKKRSADSRDNSLQLEKLSDFASFQKTYLEMDKMISSNDFKLTGPGKALRFEIMEDIVKQPQVWKTRTDNEHPDEIKQKRKVIAEKFSKIAQPNKDITNEARGARLMLNFFALEDRTLENLLRQAFKK